MGWALSFSLSFPEEIALNQLESYLGYLILSSFLLGLDLGHYLHELGLI